MSVAFSKLKPGLVLLDIHSQHVGNTMMRQLGCCWNGNPPRLYRERDFKRLYLKPTRAYLVQEERRTKRTL